MGGLKIKQRRKPKGHMTLMDAVKMYMKETGASEGEAKRQIAEWLSSGQLPFKAMVERPGAPPQFGQFRVRDRKFVSEQ